MMTSRLVKLLLPPCLLGLLLLPGGSQQVKVKIDEGKTEVTETVLPVDPTPVVQFGTASTSMMFGLSYKNQRITYSPGGGHDIHIKVDGQAIGAFGEGEFWFHIDGGYTPRPYRYTLLYALELPSTGGNTLFSNMYEAYAAVPAVLRERLKGRKALHIHEYNRSRQAASTGDIGGIPHHYHPPTCHCATSMELDVQNIPAAILDISRSNFV